MKLHVPATVAVLVGLTIASVTDCKSGIPAIAAGDVGTLVACVLAHAASDPSPTFESLALQCAPLAVADVEAIVTAVMSSSAPDGGVSSTSVAAARKIGHAKPAKP